MTRAHARKDFNQDTRLTLLETDADDMEGYVAAIQQSIARLTRYLTTAAITFGTSAVLLAVNLVLNQ